MTQTAYDNINSALIIDDDPKVARVLLETFAAENIRGAIATNTKTARQHLEQNTWNMVFINHKFTLNTTERTGTQLLRKIKTDNPEIPVVMLSDSDSAQNALAAIRQGYDEFIVKPISCQCAHNLIRTFLPSHRPETLAAVRGRCNIVGKSCKLAQTINLAKKVAPTSTPVLITGQSGTGKELIAQLIHNHSKRANAPFIKVNCASLNDSLLESEFFGHEKGAFTGAAAMHRGRFERAHGGTLMLDEITETHPKFQAKLLRVLEEMDFERVGGTENINVNVRIISTTNSDILSEVSRANFRSDLYYRLAGIRIIVPPLKERFEDLQPLIWHFVNQFAHEVKRNITEIDPVMLDIFQKYNWPGNIRQLRNVLRTSLILGSGPTLSLADISWLFDELQPKCSHEPFDASSLAGEKLADIEHKAILATLRQTDGNKTKAARALGISDRTLRDRIKKYRQQPLQLTT